MSDLDLRVHCTTLAVVGLVNASTPTCSNPALPLSAGPVEVSERRSSSSPVSTILVTNSEGMVMLTRPIGGDAGADHAHGRAGAVVD